jgi:hypothetical protein
MEPMTLSLRPAITATTSKRGGWLARSTASERALRRRFHPAGTQEEVEIGSLEAEEVAELVEGDAPLGHQAAHESLAHVEVDGSLGQREGPLGRVRGAGVAATIPSAQGTVACCRHLPLPLLGAVGL